MSSYEYAGEGDEFFVTGDDNDYERLQIGKKPSPEEFQRQYTILLNSEELAESDKNLIRRFVKFKPDIQEISLKREGTNIIKITYFQGHYF